MLCADSFYLNEKTRLFFGILLRKVYFKGDLKLTLTNMASSKIK